MKAVEFFKKKRITIISIIIILAIIAPMLYYFQYSVLNADDFLYGRNTHHAFQDTGSIIQVVKKAFSNTILDYSRWQGSFFSVFLMYLQPGIISIQLYRIVLLLMFLMCIISPGIMFFSLNKYLLKADKSYIWIIYCSYIFAITQFMPSIHQAYYWYNGAIYYQFNFNLIMLFVSAILSYHHAGKKIIKIILLVMLIIMTIAIGGSNYPSGLVFGLLFFLFIIISTIKKLSNAKIYYILFAIFVICFLINVLALGNSVRKLSYDTPNLLLIGLFSIRDMFMETPYWIKSTLTLAIIAIFIPFGKKLTQNSVIKFAHPAIVGAVILLLLLVQYVPVMYGLGHKGPLRTENIRFMMLQLYLWVFFINTIGYFNRKDIKFTQNKVIIIVLVIFILSTSLTQVGVNEYTSYKMADQIASGEVDDFGIEMNNRIQIFEDQSNNDKISFDEIYINEYLHPDIGLWFQSGIWDYYRKIPKK